MESGPRESSHVDNHVQGPADEEQARTAWWALVGTIYRRRRLVLYTTALVAIASLVISLLLPKWYESTARVILPSSSSGGLQSLLGNLDPAAAALIGGVGGDYIRYMSILTSNTMKDRIIDEFDLMDVYDTRDNKTPLRDTREELESNLEIEIDIEYDFLSISALDKDPVQAAAMANFIVDELNRMNIELATESASAYRRVVERRYNDTEANLDSAMAELQRFQEEYGLIELEQQSAAFLEVLALYRAATFEAEVEYEGLVLDFGKDSPMVRSARNRVEAARAKERALLEGEDPLMPVAFSDLPEIGRGYAKALQGVMINQKILEFARPILEQAIFEEQREAPAVQVLDRGMVAEWKAKPKRALIVIGATLSGFILVVLYVILMHWLQRNRSYFVSRIESELSAGS
jgi:uncharacterized protein involved in exopolysaccharide biosynthesis